MKKKMARNLMLLLTVLLVALSTACGTDSGSTGSTGGPESNTDSVAPSGSNTEANAAVDVTGEEMLCRYVVPGAAPDDKEIVDDAITQKLKADGINMKFTRIYIPWDVWTQRFAVMMSTGEEFEIFHVMEDWVPHTTFMGQGALAPLDEHIAAYGSSLTSHIPELAWDNTKVNGKIYTIPVYFRDFSLLSTTHFIPGHYFSKYNLSTNPATVNDLINSLITVMEGEGDPELRYWHRINNMYDDKWLREFDAYPFTVFDSLIYIGQDGEVKPWLETDEFRRYTEYFRKMYTSGLTHPDILTYPHERISEFEQNGKNLGSGVSASVLRYMPDAEEVTWLPQPQKPKSFGLFLFMNSNAVPVTSPNPEAGVIFFNWLYSSQENYDLLNFGIKDTHWKDIGNREIDIVRGDNDEEAYSFGDWIMGNKDFARIESGLSEFNRRFFLDIDETSTLSAASGFGFDSEPVTAEYANCLAQIQSVIYPLKFGVISYEDGYDAAMAAMKAAGYDRVVEEYKKQFDAWYAARN